MALQSREENVKEKMNEIPCIDVNVKIAIPRSPDVFDETKHKFKCLCCGKGFTSKNGKFNKSKDVLFQSNDGYLPWCKECVEKYVIQMTALFTNNEELAIKDFCQRAGWNYDLNPLVASRETYSGHRDRHRLFHYAAKKNLNCGGRKTFIDSLKFAYLNKQNEVIETIEDVDDYTEYKLTPKMIKFWGVNYEPQIYQTLQGYYDELLKLCETKPDIKKQKMMKNLCLLEYQMQTNIQGGKDIGTLSNSYKTMFEASGLKNEEVDTNKDSYGTWIAMIEKYTPADYYKDKNKYKDFFGIGEYIERFMFRPLKNLLTGSKEKEKEFWINDDKGGD